MNPGDRRNIKGKAYRLALFLVTSRKADGTPNECRRINDDEKVHLEGGEEFFTAFVPDEVLAKRSN